MPVCCGLTSKEAQQAPVMSEVIRACDILISVGGLGTQEGGASDRHTHMKAYICSPCMHPRIWDTDHVKPALMATSARLGKP